MESGYIVVLRKGKTSRPYELDEGEHTIGSSIDSNIRLKFINPLLLETHAVIRVNHQGVATVINKSTAAPITVNGKRAYKPTILRHSDKFQVLKTEFQYFNDKLKDEPEDSIIFAQERKNLLASSRKSVMPLSRTPAKSPTYKTKAAAKTPLQRLLNKSLGASLRESTNTTHTVRTARASFLSRTFSHSAAKPKETYRKMSDVKLLVEDNESTTGTPMLKHRDSVLAKSQSSSITRVSFLSQTRSEMTILSNEDKATQRTSKNDNSDMANDSEESAISLRLSSDSSELKTSLTSSLSEENIPATQYNGSGSVSLNESSKESKATRGKSTASNLLSENSPSVIQLEHLQPIISLSDEGKKSSSKRSTSLSQKTSPDTPWSIVSDQEVDKSLNTSRRVSKRRSVNNLSLSTQGSAMENDLNSSALRKSRSVNSNVTASNSSVEPTQTNSRIRIKNDETNSQSLQNVSRNIKGEQLSIASEDDGSRSSSQISTVHNSRETTINIRGDGVANVLSRSTSRSKCMGTFDESTQEVNFNGSKNKLRQPGNVSEECTKEKLSGSSKFMKPTSILDDSEEMLSPVQPLSSRKSTRASQENVSVNTTGSRSSTRRNPKGQISANSSRTSKSLDQSTGSVISVSSQSFSSFKKGNADGQNDCDDTEIDVVNFTMETNTPEAKKNVRFSAAQARTPTVEERQTRRSSSALHMFDDVNCTSTPFHKRHLSEEMTKSSPSLLKTPEPKVFTISSTDETMKSPEVERGRSPSLRVLNISDATERRRSSRNSTAKNGEHNCISCRNSSVRRSRSLSATNDVSNTSTSSEKKSASKAETTPLPRRNSHFEDETPKSHVKPSRRSSKARESTYNPVLEDITPVTPEKLQVSGFTETFKTPINTPGLFESIRKSVVRSRKRRRDSSGSVLKDSKRARIDYTNENEKSQTPDNEIPTDRVKRKQKSPLNRLSDFEGVKKLMKSPQKSPKNDLRNIPNLRKIMSPKQQNSPQNDLTAPFGVKKLLRSPKTQKDPVNDLTNVSGVANIFNVSGIDDLHNGSDIENSVDLFTKLTGKRPVRAYHKSKSLTPAKAQSNTSISRKSMGDLPVTSPRVQQWVDEHANCNLSDRGESEAIEKRESKKRKRSVRNTRGDVTEGSPMVNTPEILHNVEFRSRTARSLSTKKPSRGVDRRKTHWDLLEATPAAKEWTNKNTSLKSLSQQSNKKPRVGRSMSLEKESRAGGNRRKIRGDNLGEASPDMDNWKAKEDNLVQLTVTDQLENMSELVSAQPKRKLSEQPKRKPRIGRSISLEKDNRIGENRRETQGDHLGGASPDMDNWKADEDSLAQLENISELVSEQTKRKSRIGRSVSPQKSNRTGGNRRKTQGDNLGGASPDVDNWKAEDDNLVLLTPTDQLENISELVSEEPKRKPRIGRSVSPQKSNRTGGNRRKTQGDILGDASPDVDNWKAENDNLVQRTPTDQLENISELVSEQPKRKPKIGRSVSPQKSNRTGGNRRKTQGDNLGGASPDVDNWKAEDDNLVRLIPADQLENISELMSEQPKRKPRIGRSASPQKSNRTGGKRRKTQGDNLIRTPDVNNWKSEGKSNTPATEEAKHRSIHVPSEKPARKSVTERNSRSPRKSPSENFSQIESSSVRAEDLNKLNLISPPFSSVFKTSTPVHSGIPLEEMESLSKDYEEENEKSKIEMSSRPKRGARAITPVGNKTAQATTRPTRKKKVMSAEDINTPIVEIPLEVLNKEDLKEKTEDEELPVLVKTRGQKALSSEAVRVPIKTRRGRAAHRELLNAEGQDEDISSVKGEFVIPTPETRNKGKHTVGELVSSPKIVPSPPRRRGRRRIHDQAQKIEVDTKLEEQTEGNENRSRKEISSLERSDQEPKDPDNKSRTKRKKANVADNKVTSHNAEVPKTTRTRGRKAKREEELEQIIVEQVTNEASGRNKGDETRSAPSNEEQLVDENVAPTPDSKTKKTTRSKAKHTISELVHHTEVAPSPTRKRGRRAKEEQTQKTETDARVEEQIEENDTSVGHNGQELIEADNKSNTRSIKAIDAATAHIKNKATGDDAQVSQTTRTRGRKPKKVEEVEENTTDESKAVVKKTRGRPRGAKTRNLADDEERVVETQVGDENVVPTPPTSRSKTTHTVNELVHHSEVAPSPIDNKLQEQKEGNEVINSEDISSAEHSDEPKKLDNKSNTRNRKANGAATAQLKNKVTGENGEVPKTTRTRGRKAKKEDDEPERIIDENSVVEQVANATSGRNRSGKTRSAPGNEELVRQQASKAGDENVAPTPEINTKKTTRSKTKHTASELVHHTEVDPSPTGRKGRRPNKNKPSAPGDEQPVVETSSSLTRGKTVENKLIAVEIAKEVDMVDSPRTTRAKRGRNKKYSTDEYEVPEVAASRSKKRVHFETGDSVTTETPEVPTKRTLRRKK